MRTLKTLLIHAKIFCFGDKELEKEGKRLPCIKCNKMFKSYTHYRDSSLVYDAKCEECENDR
jgi:hypothetical protein